MSDYTTQDQCESRRNRLEDSLTSHREEIKSDFEGFLTRLESKVDPLIVTVTEADARSKSNTHRLNFWTKVVIGAVVAILLLGLKLIVAAL